MERAVDDFEVMVTRKESFTCLAKAVTVLVIFGLGTALVRRRRAPRVLRQQRHQLHVPEHRRLRRPAGARKKFNSDIHMIDVCKCDYL
jgi:hypothetical protein